MYGFLLVDKPEGCTSFDIVAGCRKAFGIKRVGHCGTLDPFATGLLIVAIGEACKLLEYLPTEPKIYEGSAVFGATSETYDREGTITPFPGADILNTKIDLSMINKIVQENLIGRVSQVPPLFSAVKVRGVSAHVRARQGQVFDIKPRMVQVDSFAVIDYQYPNFRFVMQVGGGTYVRTLIHDLGQLLEVGAYVTTLRRTKMGAFEVEHAVSPDELQKNLPALLPLEVAVTGLPRIDVSASEYARLVDGLFIDREEAISDRVYAGFYQDRLVGILEFADTAKLKFHKKLNLD